MNAVKGLEENRSWEPLQQEIDGVTFEVDPKLELLETIWDLSMDEGNTIQLINDYNSEYRKAVDEYFEPYKEEEAVYMLVQYLSEYWESFSSPYSLFYRLNDDFTIPEDLPEDVTVPFDENNELEKFHGLVCLIQLMDGQCFYWDLPISGKVPVCGKGMIRLNMEKS